MPVKTPFFSCVSMSASAVPPWRHSSMKAATSGRLRAACRASGCSAATETKVTPASVSGRVVNTRSGALPPSTAKSISRPSERPIQLRCMVFTASGQPGSLSRPCSSSSA